MVAALRYEHPWRSDRIYYHGVGFIALLVLAVPFGIPQQFATESVWSNLLQESIPWLSGRNGRKVAGSIEIGVKTIKMKMERS